MHMDYNDISKIGKIKDIDKDFGVGEIVAANDIYMFTIDDLNDEIKNGDIVKFRSEVVNGKNRAFFINKIDYNYKMKDNIARGKIYYRE